MKKLVLISMLIGAMPLAMVAQDDDLYFMSKKKKSAVVEEMQDQYGLPKDTYYAGSNRNVDEYNRRFRSHVEAIGDSTQVDVINFNAEKGVYPDSISEDYKLTKKMTRFEDYQLADNAAFWAGYRAGVDTWGWHSPWYYSRWGWYDPWYYPYYSSYWGWYDPWYYGYAGWYDPWYYRGYWGWGYPYLYPYRPVVVVGGGGRRYNTIGTGTLRRNGSTYGSYRGGFGHSSSRFSSLRQRANTMSGGRTYSSGNSVRSGSGNFSGYRGSNSSSRGSFSSGSGSFGGSRSGGSFGGSRGGGGFSGGGGGSRGGGGGFGGRR